MFPRANRLRRSQDILTTFRQGEKIRRGFLTVYFLPQKESRATVIVDTKLSKRAVVRNRLKRQLRAIAQEQGLPAGALVIRAYPGLEKLSFDELQQSLVQCLNHPAIRSKKPSSPA